jgi:hypothetical protein
MTKTEEKEPREPSNRQKRFLEAFGGVGMEATLKDLGNIAFKRERPEATRFSWARNQVRWLLQQKFVKKVKPGTYLRLK